MSQPVQAGMSALDFQKIKDFLTANLTEFNHEAEVCATLQALSWRINRTKGSIRRYNLQLYSHFDLIDLSSESSNSILNKVLQPSSLVSLRVKEFFLMLLNSLANEYLGRCYLLQRKDIVNLLIQILFT